MAEEDERRIQGQVPGKPDMSGSGQFVCRETKQHIGMILHRIVIHPVIDSPIIGIVRIDIAPSLP